MSSIEYANEPEFVGVFEPYGATRPVGSHPPRVWPTRKLIHQVRVELDLDDATAERVAEFVADWAQRFGAWSAEPMFTMEGGGPVCSWCRGIWPLCGHHHQSGAVGHDIDQPEDEDL